MNPTLVGGAISGSLIKICDLRVSTSLRRISSGEKESFYSSILEGSKTPSVLPHKRVWVH
jgi:hypothetical protein